MPPGGGFDAWNRESAGSMRAATREPAQCIGHQRCAHIAQGRRNGAVVPTECAQLTGQFAKPAATRDLGIPIPERRRGVTPDNLIRALAVEEDGYADLLRQCHYLPLRVLAGVRNRFVLEPQETFDIVRHLLAVDEHMVRRHPSVVDDSLDEFPFVRPSIAVPC